MHKPTLRVLKVIGGILCLIIGLAGLVLPVIPGVFFLAVGLVWIGVVEKDDFKRIAKRIRSQYKTYRTRTKH